MKKTLQSLQLLNQMKLDRVNAKLADFKLQKKSLVEKIYQKQIEVEQLYFDKGAYKVEAYANVLKNNVLKTLDIKLVEFCLNTFNQEIEIKLQQQQDLSEELVKINQQIKKLKVEIKYHITKIEKYNYCQELLDDVNSNYSLQL